MFLALAIIFAYWAGVIYFARHSYGKNRPSRVPVCGKKIHSETWAPIDGGWEVKSSKQHIAAGYTGSKSKTHSFQYSGPGEIPSCYGPKSENAAIGGALITGFLWPVLIPVGVGVALVTAGHKDRPVEEHYKTEERLAKSKADLAAAEAELARVTDDVEALRPGKREYS